jgi:RNA polymerase nonessential primary-like sigma factor
MTPNTVATEIDQGRNLPEAKILTPMPMSPGFESAMKPSPRWLAAARLLLADVRNEISDLVTHSNDDGVVVLRNRQDATAVKKASRSTKADKPEFEAAVSDAEIDAGIDADLQSEADAGTAVDDETFADDFQTGSKVGSSLDFYLKQLRSFKAPSMEEEQLLVRAAQAGDPHAVNLLVSKSLRVVPSIARTFVGRGLPLEDLIEEGNLGLYRAIPRFDISLGYRFATYARWWVKHEIRTAVLNHGRLIRLPIHIFKALSRVRRQLESAGEAMPGSATASNSAEKSSDTPISHRSDDGTSDDSLRFTLQEAQVLLKLTELPLSLDMPSAGDAESSLADTLPTELDVIPDSCLQQKQSSRLLMAALEELSSSEREVVMRRYGFQSGEPETLQAIGKSLKLTAERVRQIQKQALANIQQHFGKLGLSLGELL